MIASDIDHEILADTLCLLLPKHRGTCSRIASDILDSEWLAAHDTALAEQVWDEGHGDGVSNMEQDSMIAAGLRRRLTNPYRQGES